MHITINLNGLKLNVADWNVGYDYLDLLELESEGDSLAELLTNSLIYTQDEEGGTGVTLSLEDLDTLTQIYVTRLVEDYYTQELDVVI